MLMCEHIKDRIYEHASVRMCEDADIHPYIVAADEKQDRGEADLRKYICTDMRMYIRTDMQIYESAELNSVIT